MIVRSEPVSTRNKPVASFTSTRIVSSLRVKPFWPWASDSPSNQNESSVAIPSFRRLDCPLYLACIIKKACKHIVVLKALRSRKDWLNVLSWLQAISDSRLRDDIFRIRESTSSFLRGLRIKHRKSGRLSSNIHLERLLANSRCGTGTLRCTAKCLSTQYSIGVRETSRSTVLIRRLSRSTLCGQRRNFPEASRNYGKKYATVSRLDFLYEMGIWD